MNDSWTGDGVNWGVEFRVTIDPALPAKLDEAVVAFGRFEGARAGLAVYDPSSQGAAALTRLYVDLICGRPLPLTFFARTVETLETAVAVALFLDRELALHPKAAEVVSAVELVTQLREGGLAHVDRDLARLLVLIDGYLSGGRAGREEQGRKIGRVVQWLREYVLEGKLPALPVEQAPPAILDRGTNGFVLADAAAGSLVDAVIELYREGHLRGVVFQALAEGRERVLAFRKSPYVRFDLRAAAAHLNTVETRLRCGGWWTEEHFLLAGPRDGTAIPRRDLIETFLRV